MKGHATSIHGEHDDDVSAEALAQAEHDASAEALAKAEDEHLVAATPRCDQCRMSLTKLSTSSSVVSHEHIRRAPPPGPTSV